MKRVVFLEYLSAGATAGLVAGALVGVFEVVLLCALKGSLQDLAALLYAELAYGVLGLAAGMGLGLLAGLWGAWCKPGWTRPGVWATCAALVLAPVVLVVSKYRLERDLLGENPALTGGPLILPGLLLVVAPGTAALWFAARRLRPVARPRVSLGLYAVLVVIAAVLAYGPALTAALHSSRSPAGIPPDLRDKPNVIFIMADTLRADRLSCYGYTQNQTPHTDALAADGVRYTQMSAQASWTKPSVATMLTSLYPSSHRAIRKVDMLPSDVVMLSEVLRERGYYTAGWANNVNLASTFNFHQGYDEYVFLEPDYYFFAAESSSQLAIYQGLRRVSAFLAPGTYPQYFYQPAEVVNAHVLPWLETHRDTRFFLFIHYMDPHDPYFEHPFNGRGYARVTNQNPDPALAPAMSRAYDGEVAYLDEHLGALFQALKKWGLYDHALIVLVGDHGEEFQEHGGWWHGTTLYEEQLAVPLIIKYPQQAHAGTVDAGFARCLDLAPTIVDVLGVPAPATWQGVSLRPGATAPRAEALFAEEDHEGNVLQSLRTPQRKLIIANEGNPRGLPTVELFDLRADPGEHHNLATGEPDAVRLLRAAVDQIVAFAQAHAVAGQAGELDAATKERLRQLGY